MGGRQSRSTLANYGDDHRSHYPPSSLQSLISANPNMQRRPLPEIPRSPAESVSTQLSPVSLSCPEAARTEHVDAASLPRVVFGVEHFYAHQRQRRHHGTTSGSSLESLLLIRGLSSKRYIILSKMCVVRFDVGMYV